MGDARQGFVNVRRKGTDDMIGAAHLPEPTPGVPGYTGRTSFGLNQGDQRGEAARGLEEKASERSRKFLRPTAEDQALKDTAKRLRGER